MASFIKREITPDMDPETVAMVKLRNSSTGTSFFMSILFVIIGIFFLYTTK